jgi:hypothetical protein
VAGLGLAAVSFATERRRAAELEPALH